MVAKKSKVNKNKKKKYATTAPQEGKQRLAFTTKVDFMIYGGARGYLHSRLL